MRLLILTQKVDIKDPTLGFFHRWIIEFSKHFEKIEEIIVICLYEGKHDLPGNVKIFSLGKEKGTSKIKQFFLFYKYIIQHVKEYDIVFVHMNPEYIILGWVWWFFMRKRISLWYTHKSVNLVLRLSTFFSNKIFTASEKSFRLKSKKVSIVGHGIDTDYFVPKDTKKTIPLITIGRISPIKRIEVAIDALDILRNINDLTYTIVGEKADSAPSYLEELFKIAQDKKLTDRINLGFKPFKFEHFEPAASHDVIRDHYLQKAEIFIHSSETGSLDKAVLEAMSCGVIPITSSEAFFDLLGKYKDILIFKKGDPEDLAKKIEYLWQMSREKREELGKELRKIVVSKHSLKNLIPKLIGFLEE